MNIKVDKNLREIVEDIIKENLSESEWAERESDDWFQKDNIVGGYDADEKAFCFSFYDQDGNEYWFQLAMSDIADIHNGKKQEYEAKKTEHGAQ